MVTYRSKSLLPPAKKILSCENSNSLFMTKYKSHYTEVNLKMFKDYLKWRICGTVTVINPGLVVARQLKEQKPKF